jgi:pimeloyl-ACP methyl ester carboxylesterase
VPIDQHQPHRSAHRIIAVPVPHRVFDVTADDGAIIRVRQHGNPAGPRLVLSHGNGLAIDAYLPFWGPLGDRYELVVFDMRDHGQNPLHGDSGHDMEHFVSDLERVCGAIQRTLGRKPMAGVFHSLAALTAIRHALVHPGRFRVLILFEPPIYPRDGHPLRHAHTSGEEGIAVRTRRRRQRFHSPEAFAAQLAAHPAFRRWRPEAYGLMARATLRQDPAGDWILACPRELEARVFEENRDSTLWPRLGEIKTPFKLICGDPHMEGAGYPAQVGHAIARELGVAYEAIPNTTHFLQLERPAECVRAMERFLAAHGMAA